MYIVGGIRGSNVAQAETWYSLRGGKIWKTLESRMRKPRHKLACVEHKGKLWAIGGAVYNPNRPAFIDPLKHVDILDPATEQWSQAMDLPIPLMDHHVISYKGDLWCLGGFTRIPRNLHYPNDKGPLILLN